MPTEDHFVAARSFIPNALFHFINILPDTNEKITKNTSVIEKEADSKAEEILKVNEIIEFSKPFENYFTDNNLRDISDKLKVEPSLILGILQYHKMVEYRKLSRYKKKVKELFPDKVMMG